MLSNMIGPDLAKVAVEMKRSGTSLEKIHAVLWPSKPGIRPPMDALALGDLLRLEMLAEDVDYTLPQASLPEDLRNAGEMLSVAREELVNCLSDAEGQPNVMAHAALCKNVETAVKLHKFRIELEKHGTERFIEEEARKDARIKRKTAWGKSVPPKKH
jgi:hypothetical protein